MSANANDFSSVKSSRDSLEILKEEIQWLLHRLDVANDNEETEDSENLGDLIDRNGGNFMAGMGEKPLQFSKEDIRRLVNIGDQLSKRS